jgi:hypothetical protein
MLWVLRAVVVAVLLSSTVIAHGQEAFPPIGDRYKDLPSDAKDVVKALKKLQARTEIGVNFVDYDAAVSDVYPDVKVFVESAEAKNLPELRLVLKNAMDCYLKVRELWSIKIGSDSPAKKYDASILLITAQPTLWQVAATNISAANALIESPQEDLPKVQQTLSEGLSNLTAEKGLEIAKKQEAELLKKQRAMEVGENATRTEEDSGPNELRDLLFQDGDYGKAISGGEFKPTTEEFIRLSVSVPKKGAIRLSGDGYVVGYVLENESDAKKVYESIAAQIGRDGRIAAGLGDTSWASRTPVNEKMDVVFRRDAYVIYVRVKSKNLAEVTKRVKSVDSRIRKHLAAGDAE